MGQFLWPTVLPNFTRKFCCLPGIFRYFLKSTVYQISKRNCCWQRSWLVLWVTPQQKAPTSNKEPVNIVATLVSPTFTSCNRPLNDWEACWGDAYTYPWHKCKYCFAPEYKNKVYSWSFVCFSYRWTAAKIHYLMATTYTRGHWRIFTPPSGTCWDRTPVHANVSVLSVSHLNQEKSLGQGEELVKSTIQA